MTFPLETLPPGDPTGGVVYLRIVLSPEEASRIYGISVFGKRLSRKSDNVVVFPFAFHIAVQQPFKPKYYTDNQIKEEEMDGARRKHV
jgi:hypothetical protein